MYRFSKRSQTNLHECHEDLQRLFYEVINHYDCAIIKGHRGRQEQNEAYASGRSKLKFPESKHNKKPSLAVDAVPYPIDWMDMDRFYYFGGFVKGIAAAMGIKIRWGGDWDGDNSFRDQTFHDLPHFELVVDK